jgi:hypothetical protein
MRLFDEDLHFRQFRKNSSVSGIFCKQIVGVAPHPLFPRLSGNDDGMPGPVVVLGHVLMRGRVAAQRSAAGLTGAEMDPGSANFDAFFAHLFLGVLQLFYLLHMRAEFVSHIDGFLKVLRLQPDICAQS